MTSNGIFRNSYFITNEIETVTLSSVEYFSPYRCNTPHLIKLNTFHKDSRKWSSKLKNYEKFKQYYGCELVLGIPLPFSLDVLHHVSGYAFADRRYTRISIHGIVPEVFKIATSIYNFTDDYQAIAFDSLSNGDFDDLNFIVVHINKTYKLPNVYFKIKSIPYVDDNTRRSNVVINIGTQLLITPAKLYTQYEKFILPFDQPTWIFVSITFIVTFLTILIVNRLSKLTQNVVYGNRVESPIWNVISIFFGIAQTRLPNRNFSRFILTIFVFFCLIFRTCFQSKFFEFMTTELRWPLPRTISDLKDENYKIFTQLNHLPVLTKIKTNDWPEINSTSMIHFHDLLANQSQNSSAKLALFVDEFNLNSIASETKSYHNWNQLKDISLHMTHEVFFFRAHTFFFRIFNDIVNNLIPTGIMNYLLENYYTKKFKLLKVKKGPKVLTMADLSFGFNIWFGFCLFSTAAFVIEWSFKLLKIKLDKHKHRKIHPYIEIGNLKLIQESKPEKVNAGLQLQTLQQIYQIQKLESKMIDDQLVLKTEKQLNAGSNKLSDDQLYQCNERRKLKNLVGNESENSGTKLSEIFNDQDCDITSIINEESMELAGTNQFLEQQEKSADNTSNNKIDSTQIDYQNIISVDVHPGCEANDT